MQTSRSLQQQDVILLALFPFIALGLANGLYFTTLAVSNPLLYWIADGFQFVAVPALSFWFLIKHGVLPVDYGFHGPIPGSSLAENFGLVLFITFLYWLSFDPINSILYRVFWDSASAIPFSPALPEAKAWRILLIVYASLTAALIEESVFRALPWLYFEKRLRSPELPYVLTTSLLFGLVHWEQGIHTIVAAGILGIVAALLYVGIRNIWPFIIAHFITDMWSFKSLL
jgi:uncharacterized protein